MQNNITFQVQNYYSENDVKDRISRTAGETSTCFDDNNNCIKRETDSITNRSWMEQYDIP